MRLSVRAEFGPIYHWLSDLERQQLPFAASLAMTRTAAYARKQVVDEMRRVFDRPKPSTVNEERGPLFLKTASKAKFPNDYAEVRVKDQQIKGQPPIVFLAPEIFGGQRLAKRSEDLLRRAGILLPGYYAVPGEGARIDKYGNMSAGQIQQILSALKAQRDSSANSNARSRKRNSATADYFVAYRGRPKTSHLAEGVWQRYGRNRWKVRPVLIFVRGAPRYRKRVRFHEICEQTARMRFPLEFNLAMRRALASARVQPNPLARAA